MHQARHMMRLRQGLEVLFLHELEDQVMRWLLCLEALLHTYQEIFGAFFRDLEPSGDDLEGLGFVHLGLPGWNCTRTDLEAGKVYQTEES